METEGENIGRNTRTVNQLSEFAIRQFDSYEACRDAARDIKEQAIANLPGLIDAVEQSVGENGGEVHLAQSAADANRIIEGILADQNRDVVIIEPSDLAMVRDEYEKLLPDRSFERLSEHSYGVMEFVYGLLENGADTSELATPPEDASVAIHSHCQERTLGLDEYTTAVLEQVGYEVRTSDVECCGMAGSFGYKQEYFEVSEAVGEHLKDDLGEVDGERLVASGTSCEHQLAALYDRPVGHPVELVASD